MKKTIFTLSILITVINLSAMNNNLLHNEKKQVIFSIYKSENIKFLSYTIQENNLLTIATKNKETGSLSAQRNETVSLNNGRTFKDSRNLSLDEAQFVFDTLEETYNKQQN